MRKPPVQSVPNRGDRIELDCGYGCHESWQTCTIVEVYTATQLFGDGLDLCARVAEPGGSQFDTTLVYGPCSVKVA